jgi:hypothetical protein
MRDASPRFPLLAGQHGMPVSEGQVAARSRAPAAKDHLVAGATAIVAFATGNSALTAT